MLNNIKITNLESHSFITNASVSWNDILEHSRTNEHLNPNITSITHKVEDNKYPKIFLIS